MANDRNSSESGHPERNAAGGAINLTSNLAADLKTEGVTVAAYYSGRVRTDMGIAAADLSVDESVKGLLAQIDALSLASTGSFLSYDGQPIGF